MRWWLVIPLWAACWGPGASTPGDLRSAVLQFDVALDRALDAHDRGMPEEARDAWREAHTVWHHSIEPNLANLLDVRERIALELHLSRTRAAIDAEAGDPGAEVRGLRERLVGPLTTLTQAP